MLDCCVCLMRRSLLGHASRCAVLRMPSFARVLAVAARGPSMQALDKLAATLRLSLASGSLDGSSCSLTSAAHSSALPDRERLIAQRLWSLFGVHGCKGLLRSLSIVVGLTLFSAPARTIEDASAG